MAQPRRARVPRGRPRAPVWQPAVASALPTAPTRRSAIAGSRQRAPAGRLERPTPDISPRTAQHPLLVLLHLLAERQRLRIRVLTPTLRTLEIGRSRMVACLRGS